MFLLLTSCAWINDRLITGNWDGKKLLEVLYRTGSTRQHGVTELRLAPVDLLFFWDANIPSFFVRACALSPLCCAVSRCLWLIISSWWKNKSCEMRICAPSTGAGSGGRSMLLIPGWNWHTNYSAECCWNTSSQDYTSAFFFFIRSPPHHQHHHLPPPSPYILPIKNRKGISLPRDKKKKNSLSPNMAITFPPSDSLWCIRCNKLSHVTKHGELKGW